MTLAKSRRRDRLALDFDRWEIRRDGRPIFDDLTLDAVEKIITTGVARRR